MRAADKATDRLTPIEVESFDQPAASLRDDDITYACAARTSAGGYGRHGLADLPVSVAVHSLKRYVLGAVRPRWVSEWAGDLHAALFLSCWRRSRAALVRLASVRLMPVATLAAFAPTRSA